MTKGLYRGYSSHQYQTNKSFSIADVDLVRLDLLNHIFTRRGERVMMSNYGTRIPDLAFEPMDAITLSILEEDLRSVILFDPRVELLDLKIIPSYDTYTAVASITLLYVELNIQGNLDINITFEGA